MAASSRVVLNRSKLDELHLLLAEAVEEVARTIVETAQPPDATPFGEGLVTEGGWLVYSGPKKVGGGSLTGLQPKKPRAFKVAGTEGIVAIAGFGFPGRFQETGTARQQAHPFLWPAAVAVGPAIWGILNDIVGPRLKASE